MIVSEAVSRVSEWEFWRFDEFMELGHYEKYLLKIIKFGLNVNFTTSVLVCPYLAYRGTAS